MCHRFTWNMVMSFAPPVPTSHLLGPTHSTWSVSVLGVKLRALRMLSTHWQLSSPPADSQCLPECISCSGHTPQACYLGWGGRTASLRPGWEVGRKKDQINARGCGWHFRTWGAGRGLPSVIATARTVAYDSGVTVPVLLTVRHGHALGLHSKRLVLKRCVWFCKMWVMAKFLIKTNTLLLFLLKHFINQFH